MATMKEQLDALANEIDSICCNVCVREDENGPFILAFGLKGTHSFELRKVKEKYVLELWYGKTAEEEEVVEELIFANINDVNSKAKEWLLNDAI